MILLYVDALGMKARWMDGQLDEIRAAYSRFESLVGRALELGRPEGAVEGGVQSDAAALVFERPLDAVRVGRALFRLSFDEATEAHRFWLRGLLVPTATTADELLSEEKLDGFPDIFVRHFSDSLLEAINVEQRFKGPRLLIADAVISKELRDALATPIGKQFFIPLRQLRYAPGPDRDIAGPSWDLAYLAPETISQETCRAGRPRSSLTSRCCR